MHVSWFRIALVAISRRMKGCGSRCARQASVFDHSAQDGWLSTSPIGIGSSVNHRSVRRSAPNSQLVVDDLCDGSGIGSAEPREGRGAGTVRGSTASTATRGTAIPLVVLGRARLVIELATALPGALGPARQKRDWSAWMLSSAAGGSDKTLTHQGCTMRRLRHRGLPRHESAPARPGEGA